MKKIMKTTLALTMAFGIGFAATGCSKLASRLRGDYDGEWGLSVSEYTVLDGTKRYEVERQEGKYAILSVSDADSADKTYLILDIENSRVLHTSTHEIYTIDEGMFYSINANNEYILYLPNSSATYEAGRAYVDGNVFVDTTKNTRTYINVQGEVESVHNPLVKVLCHGDYFIKVGKKYAKPVMNGLSYALDQDSGSATGSVFLELYDKNGDYEKTVDVMSQLGLAEDEEQEGIWFIDDTLYFQTVRQLPDTEDDYDYSEYGKKYDLTTYVYNVAKDDLDTWDHYEYLVGKSMPISDKASMIYAQKIENKKLSGTVLLQVVDKRGNLYVDVQSLVAGAEFYYSDETYAYIVDGLKDVHVYKKNKKKYTIPYYMTFVGGYAYYYEQASSALHMYNMEKDADYTYIENVTQEPMLVQNRKLAYATTNAETGEKEICVFDTESGNTAKKPLTAQQTAYFDTMYAVISNENGTTDLYFYATDETLEGLNDYSYVETFAFKGKEMELIYTQKGEVGTYYMITETYPANELAMNY